MRRLLARRDREGLTFRGLSERTGIPAGTLGFWAWKLRQPQRRTGGGSRRAQAFVELVAGPVEDSGAREGRIELVLSNGRQVVLHGEIDEERVLRVVAALERC